MRERRLECLFKTAGPHIRRLNRKFQPVGAGEALEQPRGADKEALLEHNIKSLFVSLSVCFFVCVLKGCVLICRGLSTASLSVCVCIQ